MAWWYAVVESRHDLQNPTSAAKIRLLGERLGLGAKSLVLDAGSGRGGPALILARAFGCRIRSVERSAEFVAVARERVHEAGLEGLIELAQADAAAVEYPARHYDAALCLGASFIWGGLEATVAALTAAVKPGGFVAVGEPYWRTWPLPPDLQLDDREGFTTLAETAVRFEACGLTLVSVIASSQDDWDGYETLHWLALEEWLRANPGDPQADEFRERGARLKQRYLRWERELLGWAIFVGRLPVSAGPGEAR